MSDLVKDEVGRADSWGLKVYMPFANEYTYKWGGKYARSKQLIVARMSTDAREYCLGVARIQKSDHQELQALQQKFSPGTTWKISKVRVHKNEKPQY